MLYLLSTGAKINAKSTCAIAKETIIFLYLVVNSELRLALAHTVWDMHHFIWILSYWLYAEGAKLTLQS